MYNITFVCKLIDEHINNKTLDKQIKNLSILLNLNIPIVLYINPIHKNHSFFNNKNENLIINTKYNSYRDTIIYKMFNINKFKYPSQRNILVDTEIYLWEQNIIFELLMNSILENYFNTTYYSWIELSLLDLLNDKNNLFNFLKSFNFNKITKIYIPYNNDREHISIEELIVKINEKPYWRFCNDKFFIGHKETILKFYQYYLYYFKDYVYKYNTIIWIFNFFSYLEYKVNYFSNDIVYYKAKYNDEIIENIYKHTKLQIVQCMNVFIKRDKYINIDGFYAGSPCFINYNNTYILNVRYVNYKIYFENDKHLFTTNIFKTKNILYFLDHNLDNIYVDKKLKYIELNDSNIFENYENSKSYGFEDIRMYEYNGKLKFICSNGNYFKNKIQIINGEISIDNQNNYKFINCKKIESPFNNTVEKNWIPIVINNKEYFIYSWYPKMIILKNNQINNNMEIVYEYTLNKVLFENVRGSSSFIKFNDNELIGVIHVVINDKYFHMLVCLDSNTLLPTKITNMFYFCNISVEYCVGFTIDKQKYIFWISRCDNDPIMVIVPIKEVLLYDIINYTK